MLDKTKIKDRFSENECSYWDTEEEWVFVENMQPSGKDLERLVDQFSAPKEWE